MLGSIFTSEPNPKDVDILVTVDDKADLTDLAQWARSLIGQAQSKSKGADVFLANTRSHISDEFAYGVAADRNSAPGVMPISALYEHIFMIILTK